MSLALQLNNFTFNNEEYIKDRCAEVFFTNHGRFVLNCMSCYEMFHDYELFKQHVKEDHSDSDISIIDDENENTVECLEVFCEIKEIQAEIIEENDVQEGDICLKQELTEDEKANEEVWTILPSKNNDDTISQSDVLNGDGLIRIFQNDLEDSIEQDSELSEEKEFSEINKNVKHKSTIKNTRRTTKTPKRRIRPNNSNSERKHVCPICSFAFTDKSNLNSHVKRHGNEKNHHCTECAKRFFSRTELETHMRWHTGERPYICSKCGKGCLTAGDLTIHERRHTNDRRYKCNYCEKSFFNNKHLKDHTLSHTQERNFECDICHSRFLRRKSLLSHIKIHENKREYVCNICGNAYNQKPALSIHIKSKHGVCLHKKDDST